MIRIYIGFGFLVASWILVVVSVDDGRRLLIGLAPYSSGPSNHDLSLGSAC